MRTGIVASAAGATRGGGSAGAASRRTSTGGTRRPGRQRRRRTRPGSRRRGPAAVRAQRSRPTDRGPRAGRGGRRGRVATPRAHVERDRALPEDEPHLGVAVIRRRRHARGGAVGEDERAEQAVGEVDGARRGGAALLAGEPPGRGGALRNGSGGVSPRRRHDRPGRERRSGCQRSKSPRMASAETSTDGWNLSLAA